MLLRLFYFEAGWGWGYGDADADGALLLRERMGV